MVKYGKIYYMVVEFIQPKFLIAFSTYTVLWNSQYGYQWERITALVKMTSLWKFFTYKSDLLQSTWQKCKDVISKFRKVAQNGKHLTILSNLTCFTQNVKNNFKYFKFGTCSTIWLKSLLKHTHTHTQRMEFIVRVLADTFMLLSEI